VEFDSAAAGLGGFGRKRRYGYGSWVWLGDGMATCRDCSVIVVMTIPPPAIQRLLGFVVCGNGFHRVTFRDTTACV
jgi:hypothetical protein